MRRFRRRFMILKDMDMIIILSKLLDLKRKSRYYLH